MPGPARNIHAAIHTNATAFAQGEERRERFLVALAEAHGEVGKACGVIGIGYETYRKWRVRYPAFAARADACKHGVNRADTAREWDGSAGDFNARFFKHPPAWFHERMLHTLETAEGGSVTLILFPPEHGKTTQLEDWICKELAIAPETRIIVGSEGTPHARKFLRRIRNRMEPDSPAKEYVAKFGPFAPQLGGDRKGAQPWGADFFDVWRKNEHDEADYSMCAAGITGAIAGSRCDKLVLDDIQSMRNLSLTPKIVEVFRQDWLSRPGTKGSTIIIGTRVADDDAYQALIDAGLIDHLICFPAFDSNRWTWDISDADIAAMPRDQQIDLIVASMPDDIEFLWPERYSKREYARMRRNVGHAAWWRNYMQQPKKAGAQAFTEQAVRTAVDTGRSVVDDPPARCKIGVLTVDPGFGTNVWMLCGMTAEQLVVLNWRIDHGLPNNAAIAAAGTEVALGRGAMAVNWLVLEDKAFQRGLLEDEAMVELSLALEAEIVGHQTGNNKYDENIGIPSMARSFARGEIELPGANDVLTQEAVKQLEKQLTTWRPYKRGTRLTQDLVITLWFAWMRWREEKEYLAETIPPTIKTGGLPWRPIAITVGIGTRSA